MKQGHAIRITLALIVAALLTTTVGCGWLFNKQEKPLRVEVVFTGADSLNFDGRNAQAVEVKVYILRDIEQFNGADMRAFFNRDFGEAFMAEFKKDTLAAARAIIAPGETSSPTLIEVPYGFAKREDRLYFAAIANFAQPPSEDGKDRLSFKMQKKSQQTIRVQLDKNTVAQGKKK